MVTPLPSPDPREGDRAINTLTDARYRVGGGSRAGLSADDGAFGDAFESFRLELSGLDTRGFSVDLEVFSSVGNASSQTLSFGVPEPGTLSALAAAGLLLLRRRWATRRGV